VTGYRLSRRAKSATAAILTRSEQDFGSATRDRYAALLIEAMRDAADDPDRHGVATDAAIDPVCRFLPYPPQSHSGRHAAGPGRQSA